MTKFELEDIEKIAELPYDWDKLYGKTILISGGTGFIGNFIANIIRYRNEKYKAAIHVVSLSRNGGVSDETVENIAVDITQAIDYDKSIDYILHLASNTHPAQYSADPVGTITTNIIGCENLLKLGVEKKIERFLLASSVEIYGQGTATPMDESYCGYINCNTARAGYNEAKRVCEALCQSYKEQYGVNVVIARLARTIGADHKKDTKAMAQFMQNAVLGEDIILKSKGNQCFSYAYIADAVSGIFKILFDGTSGEAYNISDEYEGKTLSEYAQYIATLANKKVVFSIENNDSVSRATYALLDISKLKALGWQPAFTVSDGLKRTYEILMERKRSNKDI